MNIQITSELMHSYIEDSTIPSSDNKITKLLTTRGWYYLQVMSVTVYSIQKFMMLIWASADIFSCPTIYPSLFLPINIAANLCISILIMPDLHKIILDYTINIIGPRVLCVGQSTNLL